MPLVRWSALSLPTSSVMSMQHLLGVVVNCPSPPPVVPGMKAYWAPGGWAKTFRPARACTRGCTYVLCLYGRSSNRIRWDVNPVADFPGRNSLEPNFGWSRSGEGRGALDDVLLSDSRCQGDHRGDV